MSVDKQCNDCGGKCCFGEIDLYPTDSVYHDYSLTESVSPAEGKPYDRRMRLIDGHCIVLSDLRLCSIYLNRPAVCRAFKIGSACCVAFQNGSKKEHDCVPCSLIKEAL